MLLRFGRRAVSYATSFFALLGFVAVPLGDKTGYEHVKAVLATEEGKRATSALGDLYESTKQRLFGKVTEQVTEEMGPSGTAAAKALVELGNGRAVDHDGAASTNRRGVVSHDEGRGAVLDRGRRKHATVEGRAER